MSTDSHIASVRRPTRHHGTSHHAKIFLFPTSFMNSIMKMRNSHHVRSSKTPIRLNFTTTLNDRTNFIPSASDSVQNLEASSGHSSPRTLSSGVFSSGGSASSRSTPTSQNSSFSEYSTHPAQLRSNPRFQLSSLLVNPRSRSYQLTVVQHPESTAEFGYASLSRLPLTPPTVVQLTVRDSHGNSIVPEEELPFLIAHLSLFAENGMTPLDMGSSLTGPPRRGQPPPQPPILYGNLVASLNRLEDLNGNMGLFFLFPDVSIRWRGRFQLGITLVRICRPESPALAEEGAALAQVRTATFQVLPVHQYTAAPPTRLTQTFLRQGARMLAFVQQ
ncbi:velvet factor-domain-containing protein [Mycena rebaudengoi]|nr:velvet factor-domain-containing protein [Mycena rebaudengoi]